MISDFIKKKTPRSLPHHMVETGFKTLNHKVYFKTMVSMIQVCLRNETIEALKEV